MRNAYSPLPELNLLKEFEERLGPVCYSDGFELREYGADAGLHTWSDHPAFLSRFLPFAQANGSGSDYALWRCDQRTDLASLPVVFVGDEGDLYVIARNLRELFRLLALDSEPMSDFGFLGAGSGDGGHSEGHREFLDWLHQHFGLGPPEDVDALWAERAALDDQFRAWAGNFVERGAR
ncbi:hypothetical protein SAMN06297387_12917 [Streptomyces zhaozhouensis]|uniref:SUKH-4 immunity protein n=1 Tax=Streptomyces zhaozhouensis TaxID=1300267 RepID=A0A286E8D2_9ACTN|nr:hypothetical protein [Streptomyces zhaozhouensis]SOD67178.1 hypothetical protein SAMN06297387_12917 [Streptomyces zhaozhouensis]